MVHFIDPPTRNGPCEYAITKIRQPMSNTAAASFYFVNASGNDSPGDDEVTRIQIRRQAMSRAAAARKKGKAAARANDRRSSLSSSSSSSSSTKDTSKSSSKITTTATTSSSLVPRSSSSSSNSLVPVPSQAVFTSVPQPSSAAALSLHTVPRKMPSTGYEFMRMKQGFDILDLSSFTAFHINRGAFRLLASKPARLLELMRHRQWSYLSYLPSRYGSSQCLDDACQAVGTRLQKFMAEPDSLPDAATIVLHSRALASLQAALGDPVQQFSADTLCATQLLCLYELLGNSDDDAWALHAAGTTSLIKFRGPHRYKSEFEKALLLAHAGPIFSQSFMNNDAFFLDEEDWRNVFKSAIFEDRTCSFRSEINLSLWDIICHLPNLLRLVAEIIGFGKEISDEELEVVRARAHNLRDSLREWHKSHQGVLPEIGQMPKKPLTPGSEESRFEPLGLYINTLITANRLVVALDPPKGEEIEKQTQALAVWFLSLEREANTTSNRVGMYMSLKRMVPMSTLATRYLWKEVTRPDSNVTIATAFREWIKGLGGKRSWEGWQDEARSKLIT